MSTTTTNLNLLKTEINDPADITSLNDNWDKIDECLLDKTPKLLTSADDLNTIYDTGLYYWTSNNAPQNVPDNRLNKLRVTAYDYLDGVQELFCTDSQMEIANSSLRRCRLGPYSTSWEWTNPPLRPNEEFQTTERYNREPVFVKLGYDGIIHKRTKNGQDITPITYGTTDLIAGTSNLPTGQLYLVYE